MGVDGFIVYARDNYGVKLTEKEAAAFRNGFFADYAMLPQYHLMYKQFAKRHGWVRSPLGRLVPSPAD